MTASPPEAGEGGGADLRTLLSEAKDALVENAIDLSMGSPTLALIERIAAAIGEPALNSCALFERASMTSPNQQDVAALVARLRDRARHALKTTSTSDRLKPDHVRYYVGEDTELDYEAGTALLASEARATALKAQLARAREALDPFAKWGARLSPAMPNQEAGCASMHDPRMPIFFRDYHRAAEIYEALRSIPAPADGRGNQVERAWKEGYLNACGTFIGDGNDEAREAAEQGWEIHRSEFCHPNPDLPSEARALEWTDGVCSASMILVYGIEKQPGYWRLTIAHNGNRTTKRLGTEGQAKAAAQADYDARTRIRSAITVPSSTAQTGDA